MCLHVDMQHDHVLIKMNLDLSTPPRVRGGVYGQLIFKRKRKLVAFLLLSFMYCYYKSSLALPHDAVGCSAVCDCGIS